MLQARSADASSLASFDVYRLAVAFDALFVQVSGEWPAPIRDQLSRASASIALNVAEGYARWSGADKARLYGFAAGSASECLAILDLAAGRGLINPRDLVVGREHLARIGRMLLRLQVRLRSGAGSAGRIS